MKHTKWISTKEIIDDFLDISGATRDLSTRMLHKFSSDAVELFLPAAQFDFGIVAGEVKNHKFPVPRGFHQVVQVGFSPQVGTRNLKEKIIQWTQDVYGTDCKLTINLDCPECGLTEDVCNCGAPSVIVDVNRMYETANPQIQAQHFSHFYGYGGTTERPTSPIHGEFRLISPSQGYFRNSNYHIPNCINIGLETEITYDIDRTGFIFNFPTGEVIISYLAHPMDDEGYRLIPDSVYATEAVVKYIEEKIAYRRWRKTREQVDRAFYHDCVQLRQRAVSEAVNYFDSIDPNEFELFLRNHVWKVAPYWNYRKNLNNNQADRYNPMKF